MAYWWLNQNEDEIDFWDDDLIVVPRRDKLGKTSPSYAVAAEMKPGDLGFAFVGGDLESVFAVCLGCIVFARLMRWGLIPASVCAECNDINRRLAPANS